ncbi:hypothetical protein MHYP_G00007730 [Metynnis hypsauchen]
MAHAAAHIKKARVEMEQQQLPDLKALEKARERRKRSRERAERRRKLSARVLYICCYATVLFENPPGSVCRELRSRAYLSQALALANANGVSLSPDDR